MSLRQANFALSRSFNLTLLLLLVPVIDNLVAEGVLHPECKRIFRRDEDGDSQGMGSPLRLHKHQEEAIRTAGQKDNYVLATGMGLGKSLTYTIPIVNDVLRHGSGNGIKAIVVYPVNALANSSG